MTVLYVALLSSAGGGGEQADGVPLQLPDSGYDCLLLATTVLYVQ